MLNNDNLKSLSENPRSNKNLIDWIVSIVHHKLFPTIGVLSFAILFYSIAIFGPWNIYMKIALVVFSIPGFIGFALRMYGLSDLAPSLHEFYKRFKRDYSPENLNKLDNNDGLKK